MEINYKKRIMDKILKEALEEKGAVLLQGPKWCGKTTTAKQVAGSVVEMQNPNQSEQNIKAAINTPSFFLKGDTPRLIDEWQIVPSLWDAIRYEVDVRGQFGQFILTGSSVPTKRGNDGHSGIGRIKKVTMRTMSLYESGESAGIVSLKTLFENPTSIAGNSAVDIYQLAFLIVRGGWPLAVGKPERVSLAQARDFYEAIVDNDIQRLDENRRDKQRLRMLMRSLARNTASPAKITTIKDDINAHEGRPIDEDTIRDYLNALDKLFVTEDLLAWSPKLRSKSVLRQSPKRHFVDPSIATAALGASPEDLLNDLNTFGFLFESLCIRDLRIYADAIDGSVFQYRDSSNREIDAIIHLRNGDWGAVEIKLGQEEIEKAAANLLQMAARVDGSKSKKPSFLMIITGTQYAYRRPDGVFIVPIGALKD